MDLMNDSHTCFLFVDTNILFHFQMFNEVDWPEILASSPVCVVLSPIVLAEVDKHKDSGDDERKNRARTLVSKFKEFLTGVMPGKPVRVRNEVYLLDIVQEPLIDWESMGLDGTRNDDRLLATVKVFSKQHPANRVVLMSNDFLMQRKAQKQSVEVIAADNLLKPIERNIEAEKKLRAGPEKKYSPELQLNFWDGDAKVNKIVRPLDRKKTEGSSADEVVREINGRKDNLVRLLSARSNYNSGDDYEIEEFRREYETYLDKLKTALDMRQSTDFGQRC